MNLVDAARDVMMDMARMEILEKRLAEPIFTNEEEALINPQSLETRMRQLENQVAEQLRQSQASYQRELSARDEEIFALREEVERNEERSRNDDKRIVAFVREKLANQQAPVIQPVVAHPVVAHPVAQQNAIPYAGATFTFAGTFQMQHADLGRLIENAGYVYSPTLTQKCRSLISHPVNKPSQKATLATQYNIDIRGADFLAQLLNLAVDQLV